MESVSEFGKCSWNYIFHNVFCSFCCLALLLFMAPRVTWKYIFLISPGLLTCLFSSGFQTMLEGRCQGQWIKISLVKKSTLGSRERYGEAGCAWSSVLIFGQNEPIMYCLLYCYLLAVKVNVIYIDLLHTWHNAWLIRYTGWTNAWMNE